MKPWAYYNENDPFAAEWGRELIKRGLVAPGEIDERSIVDVEASEIRGFTQHHFFAGILGWSLALRLAGWPDDKPVLTGSPPCQPFSVAGKQLGVQDERHLAPHFLALVAALRPPWVFGEQVAAAATKDAWLDDLLDALELSGYAAGAIVLPAAAVGAPHLRQRLWFYASLNENLPEVWREKIDNGIRCRLPLLGRKKECMSYMPEQYAKGQARGKVSAGQETAKKSRKRSRVYERKTTQTCSDIRGGRSEEKSKKERAGVRLELAHERIGGKNETHDMRTFRNSIENGGWIERLRFNKPGQNRSGERIHDLECENCMLGDKCRCWDVGIGKSIGNIWENTIDDHALQNEMGESKNPERKDNFKVDNVSAPHLRQRLWFVGKLAEPAREQQHGSRNAGSGRGVEQTDGCAVGRLDDASSPRPQNVEAQRPGEGRAVGRTGAVGRPRPTHGGWETVDWLFCRDGKWRPAQPGIQPLAHGLPKGLVRSGDSGEPGVEATQEARVGRLQGYGNSIVPQLAAEIIREVM